MPIRIRCRGNHHKNGNRLKWEGVSRIFQENRWRVIRIEMGRSGSYADAPKHCSARVEVFVLNLNPPIVN